MRIKAEVVESRTASVNINPVDVLSQLEQAWKSSTVQKGEYINSEGMWESWYDTGHGSGITNVYNEATAKEKEIMRAFKTIDNVIRDLKNI